MNASPRILIMGVGNRMYGDDAFGPLFAEALERCGAPALNSELDVFTAVSHLEGVDLLIFIDVVDKSFGEPGDVVVLRIDPRTLSPEEVATAISFETSAHQVTPAHIVLLGYSSGFFRGEAYVVGVVSEHTDFARKMSSRVVAAAERACLKLREIARSAEINCVCVQKEFRNIVARYSQEFAE